MNYAQLPDDELLQRIAAQETGALEHFYDRHAQTAFNLIHRVVGDRMVAEELLQETFLLVWRHADSYKGSGSVAAWLFRIARNRSLDHLRRRQARPQPFTTESADADAAFWDSVASEEEPEREAEAQWDRQQLLSALQSIPADQRLCLELAYFEGMSQSQISEHTNIPLGTIKSRIRGGLQKLERLLRRMDHTSSGEEGESYPRSRRV